MPRRRVRDLLPGFGTQEIAHRPFAPRRTGRDDAQRREDRQHGQGDPQRFGATPSARFLRLRAGRGTAQQIRFHALQIGDYATRDHQFRQPSHR